MNRKNTFDDILVNSELRDITSDLGEVLIDKDMSEGILKDIPILGIFSQPSHKN